MVKTNLAITEHEDKTSQNGKDYTRFKTNNGWMSCFESDVIKKCKDNEGKIVSLEIAESEKNGRTFQNIRGFYDVVSGINEEIESTTVKPQEAFTEPRKSVKGSAYEKDPVGLAVEVFGMLGNPNNLSAVAIMKIAIEAVQQAQKAFS